MIGTLDFTINVTTVCAASGIENVSNFAVEGIAVMAIDEGLANENDEQMAPALPETGGIQSRSTFDLSEKSATINWYVKAESSSQSRDDFKTNSTAIEVTLKSNIESSVTVILLDSAGTELEKLAATLSKYKNTKFKFSGLTSAERYKIKVKNNGQSDIDISGTIKQ